MRQFRLDITNRVVTEIADQATMKLGQAFGLGNLEGVSDNSSINCSGSSVSSSLTICIIDFEQYPLAEYLDAGAAGHADDRIAPPFFATLHRFE